VVAAHRQTKRAQLVAAQEPFGIAAVGSVDPIEKTVTSLEGETVSYDLLVLVPPHRGQKMIEDSNLGDSCSRSSAVPSTTTLHATPIFGSKSSTSKATLVIGAVLELGSGRAPEDDGPIREHVVDGENRRLAADDQSKTPDVRL
jgi:hypothetical protein